MTTEFHLIDTIELFEDAGALYCTTRDDDGAHTDCLEPCDDDPLAALDSED